MDQHKQAWISILTYQFHLTATIVLDILTHFYSLFSYRSMDKHGSARTSMDQHRLAWISIDKHGQAWISMDKHGSA